ncbi:hypothetical protein X797_009510 [Metarhizium robertsii]|uniref:Apple domain-containing protein n=2 Tax=Metarhizium robertsii TaxID=568076 RepID=A0A0A1UQJ3_9HYPO|nr:hypothetical protein X797_009510 [Metarhizium robertsii]
MKMLLAQVLIPPLLFATALAAPGNTPHERDNTDGSIVFPGGNGYAGWAICGDQVSKQRFPRLQVPAGAGGGCVRYYRGIDMTGVVTELHFFFRDGFRTACDCAAKCLSQPASCNNWVWKHTFMPGDGGRRSCTLYSSPNLPSNVTLDYDEAKSSGFQPLSDANNPQVGGDSPLTFLDDAGTKPDPDGVSGFTAIDQNGGLYC